ncbi:amidohydrolase [Pseudidiomarina salinarum]|uniref:Amidohydrolase n=1 Tax=Pseudidiomarina salinarum TaxID=435908 RepID=A0A094JF08_9GAMM|nr:amidohydrolase family protein [Pseudidiomarina salinarum]KFZ31151.1 amidohydrolase [Pseudidiomarina salinarum]RUO71233.1 amidohydrolase [Pseudidiomarina salinarum]
MPRLNFGLILSSALLVAACSPQPPEGPALIEADQAVVNTAVIDFEGRKAVVREQQTVLIKDDRIVHVGPTSEIVVDDDALVIEGDGRYLLAGLTEMHGHVPPAASFGELPERYLNDVLFLYVANGVTTVRGMLGYPHQLQLKDDIASGQRMGPTLYLAGPSFSGNSVESAAQATQRVIEQRDQGWDLLKIHPGLTLEEYLALTSTATAADMDFAGHVPSAVGLEVALKAGQRTIDHLDGYLEHVDALTRPITEEELLELVQMTIRYEAGVVPTQALWATLIGAADEQQLKSYPELNLVPPAVRKGWLDFLKNPTTSYFNPTTAAIQQQNRQRLLKALHDGGAEILFGTDAPQLFSVPGFSIHREIDMMAEADLTPAAILYSATVATGNYFAEQDRFGRIAAGHRADFLLLPGNPLDNADVLRDLDGVMIRGYWLDRAVIDARLAEIQAAYTAGSAEGVL